MKKNILILSIASLALLTGCYDGDNLSSSTTVGELKTLPATESDTEVVIKGEAGGLKREFLRFQIARTRDFSGESVFLNFDNYLSYGSLSKNGLSGTYYYRLCAADRNDTVYSQNVESFTVDNILSLSEPNVYSDTSVSLFCSSKYPGTVTFMVSKDKDFAEYSKYENSKSYQSDSHYKWNTNVLGLTRGTTYYVKAVREVILGTVESDVISFTTNDNTIKSIGINGEGIDGQRITDDLMVVIQNLTTKEWSMPYTAVYNENRSNYEIQDFDYTVENDTWYAAYAVTSTKNNQTIWDNSGYVVFGQSDYQNGAGQIPICWGVAEINGSDPYIKMDLRPWTAQITVEYPARWGMVDTSLYGLAISSKNRLLPGSSYDIISRKGIVNSDHYFGRPSEEARLSEDGKTYSFTFNIFPTKISASDCSMILYLVNDKKDVPCPDLSVEMGRQYTITFDEKELEILDVTVKEWEPENGGSIIINPNK